MATIIPVISPVITRVKGIPSNSAGQGTGNFVTNLMLQSQTFDSVTWGKGNSSVTADAGAAPDGTTTADKLVENNATNFHLTSQSVNVVSGQAYTFSCFAKAGERSWIQLLLPAAAFTAGTYAFINLATGAVGTVNNSPTIGVTSYGNGWWRISLSKIATATTGSTCQIVLATGDAANNYAGDNASGLLIWGCQMETGWTANTYVPTVASTVTAEV